MKLLCNLPLESFAARDTFPDIELVTYGPNGRMLVDGQHYPFDIEFDPATGTIDELLQSLPKGFMPDALVIYWPDQEPIPQHLEECPIPVIGIVSDYNLTLPHLAGLWPFFDTLLVDRQGVGLFARLSFADPRYYCQYTFKAPTHHIYPGIAKDLDIVFAGNLNPVVQRERAPWLDRVRALATKGIRTLVRNDVYGADYGRFLNRAHIGFNRSIRGEMNLRGFEVPACGALLLMEADNTEVRDFFVPDQEVVLYNADNFEVVVESLLGDPDRCRAIAAAGHRRVQNHSMAQRLCELQSILADRRLERPSSTSFDCALGRGVSMLSTWARGRAPLDQILAACRLSPEDPRPLNALAVGLLREDPDKHAVRAIEILQSAWNASQSYVPAVFNLTYLYAACEHPQTASLRREALLRLEQPSFADLDGLMLPLGFQAETIGRSLALAEAVRHLEPQHLAAAVRACLPPAPTIGAPALGMLV